MVCGVTQQPPPGGDGTYCLGVPCLSYSPEWVPQPWETGGHTGLGSSTSQPLQSPGKLLKNADLQAPPRTYRIRISRRGAAIPQL